MASSAEVEVPTSSLQVEPRLEEVAEVLPAQKDHDYRSYANAPQHVVRFYHENHIKQTYSFALAQKLKYGALDSGFEMGIWYDFSSSISLQQIHQLIHQLILH